MGSSRKIILKNKKMRKIDIREILKVQSVTYKTERMRAFIKSYLKDNNIDFYEKDGNIYATKNPNNETLIPALVSHTDTVHDIIDNFVLLESSCGTIYKGLDGDTLDFSGVGGDDKVGIYYCLRALEELDAVKVAFFRDEEFGCLGSIEADMSFFDDVSMIFQGDRKGNDDFVTRISGTELSNDDFLYEIIDIISDHGYDLCPHGGITDVGQLRDNGFNRPVANISCGYYNPHSDDEYIDMIDVENGFKMLMKICRKVGNLEFEMPEVVNYRSYYGYGNYGSSKSKNIYNAYDSMSDEDFYNDSFEKKDRTYANYNYVSSVNNWVHWEDTVWNSITKMYEIAPGCENTYLTIDDDNAFIEKYSAGEFDMFDSPTNLEIEEWLESNAILVTKFNEPFDDAKYHYLLYGTDTYKVERDSDFDDYENWVYIYLIKNYLFPF